MSARAVAIDQLGGFDNSSYSAFVDQAANGLLYHTPAWLNFIQALSPLARPLVLAARMEARIVGVMASFLVDGPHGPVVNALPYFGSHGDMVIADDVDRLPVIRELAWRWNEILKSANVAAVNVVAHPLSPAIDMIAETVELTRWDGRIGQISILERASSRERALDQVLSAARQKTRNLIRKGLNRGFAVEESDAETDWQALIEHHQLGMARIGGREKSDAEFSALRRHIPPGAGRKLFVARRDGQFAGGLLCLYHRDWVEYFTPVVVEAFRSEQVLSAVIAEALIAARLAGLRYWNWGGTWATQAGVHHFKQGWGAQDFPYDYFGRASKEIASTAPDVLLAAYPYFYVRPFQSISREAEKDQSRTPPV